VKKGVVAAGHEVTAQAAIDMLEDGGNAFDAALAAMLAACVSEAVLCSPGGGGFLMARTASGTTVLYDFFVQTPRHKTPPEALDFRAISADFGPATQEFHIGAGAAAVPGFVPGLFAVHGDLGRLPMTRIVEPAIKAAREGVPLAPIHAYIFTIVSPILTASDEARRLFAPGGALMGAGETFRNPALADMFAALAETGPELFVEGEAGRAMLAQSVQSGGHLSLEDLRAYRVERRAPLHWTHRGHELALNPAPAASGVLIAFALGLTQRWGKHGQPVSPALLSRIMENTNAVRDDLAQLSPCAPASEIITTQLHALQGLSPATRGTTHISVIDGLGNAASVTISNGEGNGAIVDGCGFMLNNMLGEEDVNPGGFHQWAPGTRMSSMMAPTLITAPDGAITALGSGGSNRIRSAILTVALNLIDAKMSPSEAVRAPRLHFEKCGTVSFEDRFAPGARDALLRVFPDARAWPDANLFFGGVHAASRHADGTLDGAGDPRRGGVCMIV
jgi:gamma-glutamyltranspeptidase/glutathione hydrolase